MRQPILKISHLTKIYTKRSLRGIQKTTAVSDLSLEVYEGEIFGFLGPNAAGKTTTLNMMVGVVKPTSGAITLFGRSFSSGQTRPLERLGYLPETCALVDEFTVGELLGFYADIFSLPNVVKRKRVAGLLEEVGLSKFRATPIKKLSMGQRRLVDLAQALVNDPDLLLLDEPTVYLDPLAMERLRGILKRLKARGKTIVMSSHMLAEIEKLSDRVAVIDQGELLKIAPSAEFTRGASMEEEFLRIIRPHHVE